MNLAAIVEAGAAGGGGAAARAVVDLAVRSRVPAERAPLATLVVNVTGSLLLGVLAGAVEFHHGSSQVTLIGGTGFCGGYTTFSTASVEAARMLAGERPREGALLVVATVLGTIGAAALGLWVASA